MTQWAAADGAYLRSQLVQRGLSIDGWPARQVLDLIYSLLVEYLSSGMVAQFALRKQLDEFLLNPSNLPKAERVRARAEERATWGLTPEAREGARAMMALAGSGPIKKPETDGR